MMSPVCENSCVRVDRLNASPRLQGVFRGNIALGMYGVHMRSMHDFRSIAGICTVLPGVCLLISSQCSAEKPPNGIFSVLPSYIFC